MFLSEPAPTAYDLRFNVLGFPVRVHPMFWLMTLVLGSNSDGEGILIWIAVVFTSILVHELGHAIAMRYYGESARVVLWGMGGLAISDYARSRRSPWTQIAISFAGPAAGFMLAGIVVAGLIVSGGEFKFVPDFPMFWRFDIGPNFGLQIWDTIVFDLLWVNFFWGLVNLLPVYPLDGGQISRELFGMYGRGNGYVNSLWLSAITAAAVAIWAISQRQFFQCLFFGMMAYDSYTTLQQFGGRSGSSWR